MTDNYGALLPSAASYAWIATERLSRFQGFFVRTQETLLRTISHLSIFEHATTITISGSVITMQLPEGTATVQTDYRGHWHIHLPQSLATDVYLDCKSIFDDRVWGRHYTVEQQADHLKIQYRLEPDGREGGTKNDITLELFGVEQFTPRGTFVETSCSFDVARNAPPASRWEYHLGNITTHELTIRVTLPEPLRQKKTLHHPLAPLILSNDRLVAGYPWFFESWTRDELISCGGLLAVGDKVTTTAILTKYIPLLGTTVLLPSKYPSSSLGAADGWGWWAFRVEQLLNLDVKLPWNNIELKDKLAQQLDLLWANRGTNGLIHNKDLETWMDTSHQGDTRAGACIEIQALTLVLHRLYERLNGKPDPRKTQLIAAVRKQFVHGLALCDRAGDDTQRPNIVLAHHLVPELFSTPEWITFFDTMLQACWLPWGGLSSIATNHKLFTPEHSGQDNISYHRGDSWWWINHLAAISLSSLDQHKYADHIQTIVRASERVQVLGADQLPELSSAATLSPKGCLFQTWSLATWLELQNIYK